MCPEVMWGPHSLCKSHRICVSKNSPFTTNGAAFQEAVNPQSLIITNNYVQLIVSGNDKINIGFLVFRKLALSGFSILWVSHAYSRPAACERLCLKYRVVAKSDHWFTHHWSQQQKNPLGEEFRVLFSWMLHSALWTWNPRTRLSESVFRT